MKPVNDSSMRVGRGSLACNDKKKVLNRGSTNPDKTPTVTKDIRKMTIGYASADLIFRLASMSRSMYFDNWSST